MLRTKRTVRKRRWPLGERTGGRIVGMVSIDDRPDEVNDRRVAGAREGDLIIGRVGATLVGRTTRFLITLGLAAGKDSTGLADVLIDRVNDLPRHLRGSLTWDQGTEMAKHAAVTVATDLPIYFAHPHPLWEQPSNENTSKLISEYLPKGVDITDHQPYLGANADELDERPRQILRFLTPREAFERLLFDNAVATKG